MFSGEDDGDFCDLDWHMFAGKWLIRKKLKSPSTPPPKNFNPSKGAMLSSKYQENFIPQRSIQSIDYYVDDRNLAEGRPVEIDIVWTIKDSITKRIAYSCGRGKIFEPMKCSSILRVVPASCPNKSDRAPGERNLFPWGFSTSNDYYNLTHRVYVTDYNQYAIVGDVEGEWIWLLKRDVR